MLSEGRQAKAAKRGKTLSRYQARENDLAWLVEKREVLWAEYKVKTNVKTNVKTQAHKYIVYTTGVLFQLKNTLNKKIYTRGHKM